MNKKQNKLHTSLVTNKWKPREIKVFDCFNRRWNLWQEIRKKETHRVVSEMKAIIHIIQVIHMILIAAATAQIQQAKTAQTLKTRLTVLRTRQDKTS